MHKRAVQSTEANYQIHDQTNLYTITNALDKEVTVKVDITGSEGAMFEGTYSTVNEVKVSPNLDNVFLAEVRLFGDWLLRIRFTYTI